ncbi:unnamed protein product [Triticum turgidum subsp. durum]|uniref:Protein DETOXIFICATION n=1 Tax=Triticum turgidum subsp. durum TaxID=4567 RepID=A0A9R1A173_TRITD|nr:unnamed protein product [Triticum turgidum subsp. durum]
MASCAGGGDEPLTEALLARAGSGDKDDLEEIHSVSAFLRCAAEENRRLWHLAGPAIFTSLAQYSLGAITQVAAGHLTTLELDAVSTENSVVAGLAFGIMYGMGSALETLCGQAYGAKKLPMLGVYLQRSWLLLTATAVCMLPLYLFATPILRFFHQDDQIAVMAGRFSLYMIPQLFAYALNFPIQKFLQAQSKLVAMAAVSAAALVFHVALTWFLVVPMRMDLVGLAVALNASWWFVVLGQLAYIVMGYCPGAWNGFQFDSLAFTELFSFARLSIGSAIMIWLGVLVLHVPYCDRGQSSQRSGCRRRSLHLHQPVRVADHGVLRIQCSHQREGVERAGRGAAAGGEVRDRGGAHVVRGHRSGLLRGRAAPPGRLRRALHGEPRGGARRGQPGRGLRLHAPAQQRPARAVRRGRRGRVAVAGGVHQPRVLLRGRHPGRVHDRLPAAPRDSGMWGGMLTGVGLQTVILIAITMRTNWNKEAREASSRIRQWGGGGDGASPRIPDSF